MNVFSLLLFLVHLGIAHHSLERNSVNSPIPKRNQPFELDIANRLREALKSGTATEKEAAINAIRDLKAIQLIPDLIEAIEDPTPLTDPSVRDCKAGWVFVGHQAATVLAEIARDLDGIPVGMKPGDRTYQSYSFHGDLTSGEKLKGEGRLSEVRKNWAKWWAATRK